MRARTRLGALQPCEGIGTSRELFLAGLPAQSLLCLCLGVLFFQGVNELLFLSPVFLFASIHWDQKNVSKKFDTGMVSATLAPFFCASLALRQQAEALRGRGYLCFPAIRDGGCFRRISG